jgi:hypothetical protein
MYSTKLKSTQYRIFLKMLSISIFIGTLALITLLIARRVGAKKGVQEMEDLNYFFDDVDNYNDCEIKSPKNRHKDG